LLSGEFERKLRKLNRGLQIWCGNDNSKPAGLFIMKNGEYTQICGVDKNYIPKTIIKNSDGSIFKAGWLRTLKILLKQGYIERFKAEKVFNIYLGNLGRKNVSTNNRTMPQVSPIENSSRG